MENQFLMLIDHYFFLIPKILEIAERKLVLKKVIMANLAIYFSSNKEVQLILFHFLSLIIIAFFKIYFKFS